MKNLDILYVGGGATAAMLAHWQKTGIAKALIAAANASLILSGVSAGAICWFSELLLGTAKKVMHCIKVSAYCRKCLPTFQQ